MSDDYRRPLAEDMLVTISIDLCKKKQKELSKFEKILTCYLMTYGYVTVDGNGGLKIHKDKTDRAESIKVRRRIDPLRPQVEKFRDDVMKEMREEFGNE